MPDNEYKPLSCVTYNGWTNYETWTLALWLDNEEGTYSYWLEQALKAYQNALCGPVFSRRTQAMLDLAACLRANMRENTPTVTGFYADLLKEGLCVINYDEIAEHWIAAVIKDESGNKDTNVVV